MRERASPSLADIPLTRPAPHTDCGAALANKLRFLFPQPYDRVAFVAVVLSAAALLAYALVVFANRWSQADTDYDTIFKTHDAAEFVPAMRVCTRLDTVTMLLSLHRRVQLSRDGNVSQEVSAVWSMDPRLKYTESPYPLVNAIRAASGQPPLPNSTSPDFPPNVQEQVNHWHIVVGGRSFCLFANLQGAIGVQHSDINKQIEVQGMSFFAPQPDNGAFVSARTEMMHVSLFDALPAHTPPEEVWDFITSEENNLQWDEQGISVPMLADTTIQYTKTMGKKLHKATTSAYNLVTSSGGLLKFDTGVGMQLASKFLSSDVANAGNYSFGLSTMFVTPRSFVVTSYEQRSSYSFASWCADLGGVLGLLATAMAFLFPTKRTEPRTFRPAKWLRTADTQADSAWRHADLHDRPLLLVDGSSPV